MQKYLYRNVIAFIATAILFAANLNAQITPKNMATKIKKEFNLDTSKKVSLKNKDFLKNLDKASKKSFLKYGSKITNSDISDIVKKDDNNATKNTIFYLYSESMPFVTIKNLIPQISKFKKYNPNTQFFIVFNGFPKKQFFQKLRKEYKAKYRNILTVKVHPFIYKYYNMKMVPAYIFVRCGLGDNFRFKKCRRDKAILAKGDMSLVDFFNVLSDKKKKYLKYYNEMIKAE